MNLDALRRPLGIDEVDFRVQSVNKGGYATILVYKDARADMIRLDEAVGPLGWKREHTNGNANCTVSLYNKETGEWVSKEDTGSESNTEAAKGLASDSFKRACFNWGIGRELYDYPLISVKLLDNELDKSGAKPRPNWNFKLKEWTWFSQFKDGVLVYLAAKDQNGKKRFAWGTYDADLKEESVAGQVTESEPEQDSPTAVKEESNPEGMLKKKAEPVIEPVDVEEQIPETDNEDDERASLVVEYEKLFGRKPHGKASIETIQVKIDEYLAEHGDGSDEEEDPYAKKVLIDNTVEIEEAEEVEDVDLGMYGGPIAEYATKIDTFTSREELKDWAINSIHEIAKMPGVSLEHKSEFKDAVNDKYEKLS